MMDFKRLARGPIAWLVAIIVAVVVLSQVVSKPSSYKSVDLTQIESEISSHQVESVTLRDKEQRVEVKLRADIKTDKTKQSAEYPDQYGQTLVALVNDSNDDRASGTTATTLKTSISKSSTLLTILFNLLPILLLIAIFIFFMNQMQGGGSRVMQFGKSKAKLVSKDTPKTTFADVAGADEAIEELQEIKEFLENPAKFQAIGAKIPKGVLLYGPPGTGKTLLARAVAGEAGVPFYSISGSDFVEMFVGVGASRVRDLFEQAKANAPAIIFVDEIDAVGRHRGAGLGGGHDEREQTLNQLLVEMDGFDVKGGVILIAATNRPDILDPALLRPGRFDRQIVVDRPDLVGRKAILDVHAKGKPIATDVDLDGHRPPDARLHRCRPRQRHQRGRAAHRPHGQRAGHRRRSLEESIDRVMAGPERKTRVMSDKEKKIIAYHEGGHALVAHALPNTDPVHKMTILPRGRALGYTMVLPEEDKYSQTRSRDARPARVRARRPCRRGARLPRADHRCDQRHREGDGDRPRDGHPVRHERPPRRAEVRPGVRRGLPRPRHGPPARLLRGGRGGDRRRGARADRDRARRGVRDPREYRDVLDDLVLRLLDKETLDKDEVLEIFAPVKKRPSRDYSVANPRRQPSDVPPVLTPAELALLGPADVADLVKPTRGSRSNGGNGGGSNGGAGAGGGNVAGSQPRPRRTPSRPAA